MKRLSTLIACVCTTFMSLPAVAAGKLDITAVYPTWVVQGAHNVKLAVVGTDITPGTVIYVDGKAEETVVQGSTMALFVLPVTPASVQVTMHAANGAVSNVFKVQVIKTPGVPKKNPSPPPVTSPTPTPTPAPVITPPPAPAPLPSAPSKPLPSPGNGSNTWYVRTDGGTRYSVNQTSGQCNGLSNAPYSGTGVNQNCAFNDVRFLWTDGSYTTSPTAGAPSWGWIGAGGDTYIILGSIADGVSYRVGQNGPNSSDYMGLAGDPYDAGAPVPPAGTPGAHTKVLGGNYASCTAQSARTQLHGGFGVSQVLNMAGAKYVDVACLDITDFSACGRAGQANGCQTGFPISDYATNGIIWSNQSTNDTLTDVRVHGVASAGMIGPTGDGVVLTDLALVGNPSSGWNADLGDGTTGTGNLLIQNFNISWNGCSEEYPIVDGQPYADCTDDNIGGYGDGFGTTSVPSAPGWHVHFDNGTVSYNTQDGLDALHLTGAGSSVTFSRVLSYGNMGQQLKAGTAVATLMNNVVITNCNAMRQNIPGTPAGYNSKLSDFCRAADAGIAVSEGAKSTLTFDNNTVYTASATTFQIGCDITYGPCDGTSLIDYRNNIFLGFLNNTADGYPGGGSGDYANPIYIAPEVPNNPFTNPGSVYSNNLTFHPKSNWTCPAAGESNAICGVDPLLADETWHLYGYNNAEPTKASPVLNRGVTIPLIVNDITGVLRTGPISIGAYQQ